MYVEFVMRIWANPHMPACLYLLFHVFDIMCVTLCANTQLHLCN